MGSNGRSYTYVDGILTGYRQSAAPSAHSQTMTVGGSGWEHLMVVELLDIH